MARSTQTLVCAGSRLLSSQHSATSCIHKKVGSCLLDGHRLAVGALQAGEVQPALLQPQRGKALAQYLQRVAHLQ